MRTSSSYENQAASFRSTLFLICALFALLSFVFCTLAAGQDASSYRRPETTREAAGLEQSATANALRAPESAQRAVEKAVKAMANNDSEEAVRQLSRALTIYPDYAKALTLRAIWNMTTHRSDPIADLERAIRLDPGYGVAYAVLASVDNDSLRYDEALEVIGRAVQLLPSSWAVHYEMARTLCGKHRNLEALREVTDAIQRIASDPTAQAHSRATLHYLRGRLLMDQQEFRNAKVEFELVLSEEPQGGLTVSTTQNLARLESQGIR